jgi:hypothetical protein
MLIVAATRSNSSASLYLLVPLLVFLALGFVASMYRLRRGGPGPAVNYVPRPWRQALNARYARKGWQQPYDANGNRNPDRTQL